MKRIILSLLLILPAVAGAVECPGGTPQGYQCETLTSLGTANSACSILNAQGISPQIAIGDTVKVPTTTGNGKALAIDVDCEMSYPDTTGARDTSSFAVYDASLSGWMTGTVNPLAWNNTRPRCLTPQCAWLVNETFINGVAMTAIVLTDQCRDDDASDTLTATSSDTGAGTGDDKRTTGTSISNGLWSGTPSCASGNTTGNFTYQCTDTGASSITVKTTWTCLDQVAVPSCVGVAMQTCFNSAVAATLSPTFTSLCDAVVASGNVISQSVAGGTDVNPFSEVGFVVSTGVCGSARRTARTAMTPKISIN